MYPSHVFALFPPFPRDNRVFLAMSFDARFERRWAEVIQPAVEQVAIGGIQLQAHRVDIRMVSDSILTEILSGIGNCQLVLADISALGKRDEYVIRNGNVMYEVGLAHAVRLPEEVLLFRSDDYPLLFDVANVRVNMYDPDGDPGGAIGAVKNAVFNALREIELRRHLSVQAAVRSLGADGWEVLVGAAEGLKHPQAQTTGQVLGSAVMRMTITHLLAGGLIETAYPRWTSEMPPEAYDVPARELFEYKITPFGKAVFEATADKFVSSHEELEALLRLHGDIPTISEPENRAPEA